MVESLSVEYPQFTVLASSDSGGSWSIIEQSKLSKSITWLVVLEVGVVSIDDLGATKLSRFNNIKYITLISLADNNLSL
jgi:hypothetical protein